jgi:peptidoglycan/LPS O-acetylase OafA/YrhL
MKVQPQKTERIHALDSLRAIMMLLGIVLHTAMTYADTDFSPGGWILKDIGSTDISNDYIYYVIHSFRMQTFFVVAGFFASLLFYERSPIKMIKNRISRIVLPFIVFLFVLYAPSMFSMIYSYSIFQGSENALSAALNSVSELPFFPKTTMHLWFLYYLSMITVVSVGMALFLKKLPAITRPMSQAFNWVIERPILRVLIFAALTSIVYFIMGAWWTEKYNSFTPNFNAFLYYGFFYFIGWILFKSKHLLNKLMTFDWACAILGLLLYTAYLILGLIFPPFNPVTHILINSLVVWLFIFGITGLFMRYGSNHSPLMRYVSDSSYWVYLLHLPLTFLIPGLIADWPLPSTLKMLFVVLSTGVICFVSYHYLVRGTFIGKFLNGRKYSRKLSDLKQPEESPQLKAALDK